ncbi:hypothetical protein LUZ60_001818 [Juncus effusus]|nr:hypothetical protein LUZ60_001818 [Juncus effusus]
MGVKVLGVPLIVLVLWVLAVLAKEGDKSVDYDGRSLMIDGKRKILFSGSIHYPRSTPEMWPDLIAKAKEGGLDVIQTYVFWNVHEPIQGQYNFEGRFDLVRFIKEVQAQGLYVSLRIGPFIEAEWQYGGFPFWLHDIPNIIFRCDNDPFKQQMQKFVTKIVNMMKSENLFYPQGGPIIISQIENEYKNVEGAFHALGPPYLNWAAWMAMGLKTGVPWAMCKQDDAPGAVINACNGLSCGETWSGPNSPAKPALWMENWTSNFVYGTYGQEQRTRSTKEIAFVVALFIAKKNGSFVNYYMYHGGTNFGRSASPYVVTSYYDLAPLDEYGLIWQPTWAHLRDLHAAISQSSDTLLYGSYSTLSLGNLQEAHVFETNSDCVAFLVNLDAHETGDHQFLIYDKIPDLNNAQFTNNHLLEQLSTTKDATDYLWYTTSFNNPSSGTKGRLHVESFAHVIHAFINYKLVGSAHGNHDKQGSILDANIWLEEGINNISLLSAMVGSPDSGPYLERRFTGMRNVELYNTINGSNLINLNNQNWGYQVGLIGETNQIYSKKANWESIQNSINQPLIWYKTEFDAPAGTDPVTLNLSSMGKGEAWVNGESIGRFWVSFKTENGQPSQSLYHVPRSFLEASGNQLVIFEEEGGNPMEITINTISVN